MVTRHRIASHVVVALASLMFASGAFAQGAAKSADATVRACQRTVEPLWTFPFVYTHDPDSAKAQDRASEAHRDSVRAIGNRCLAPITLAHVSDAMLDTLFDLQRSLSQDDASIATLWRMMRAAGPVADRAVRMNRTLYLLPRVPAVIPLIRAFIPLADSGGNIPMRANMRLSLADAIHRADRRAGYRELLDVATFLGGLDSARRDSAASEALYGVANATGWAVSDSVIGAGLGVAYEILRFYPNNKRVMDWVTNDARTLALVGTPAKPLGSQRWINAPAGTVRALNEGRVTLVEFSEYNCEGCKLAYTPMQKMAEMLGKDGFDALFVVPGGEFVDSNSNQAPRDSIRTQYTKLFEHYGVTQPIMLADKPDAHSYYRVGTIPHFVLFDRHGIVRDTWLGWNAVRADQEVRKLLAER